MEHDVASLVENPRAVITDSKVNIILRNITTGSVVSASNL